MQANNRWLPKAECDARVKKRDLQVNGFMGPILLHNTNPNQKKIRPRKGQQINKTAPA